MLAKNRQQFHIIVDFNPARDKLVQLDFTAANTELTPGLIADTAAFSKYINKKIAHAKYGIGGYNEDRVLYTRSNHFASPVYKASIAASGGDDSSGELVGSRSIHLGIDIWAAAGTKVYVPVGGTVHSFAFNNNFGDYGATIILQHNLDITAFYTLYGHLSLADLTHVRKGKFITRGEVFGHFGPPAENGDWPPHLHFQVIKDIGLWEGDFPGVCDPAAAAKFLKNCPDPALMLNL